MTITAESRPVEAVRTPESQRLARINADLAAIDAKRNDPQGWAQLLEDERSRLLSERAGLLMAGAGLTVTTVLGA